jgi:hypothetical protein
MLSKIAALSCAFPRRQKVRLRKTPFRFFALERSSSKRDYRKLPPDPDSSDAGSSARRYVLRIGKVASANAPRRKARLDFRIHFERGIHVGLGSTQIAAASLSNAAPKKRGWLE